MKARHAFFALATLTIFGGVVFADTTFLQVQVKSGGVSSVYVPELIAEPAPEGLDEEPVAEVVAWTVRALPERDFQVYHEGVLLVEGRTGATGVGSFETGTILGDYIVQWTDLEGGLFQEIHRLVEGESVVDLVMRPSLYADSDEENLYFYGFFLPKASLSLHLLSVSMQAEQLAMTDETGLYAFAIPIASFVYGDYELYIEGAYGANLYRSDSLVFEYVPEPQDPGYVEYMESKGLEPEVAEVEVLEPEVEVGVAKEASPVELSPVASETFMETAKEKVKNVLEASVAWLFGESKNPDRVDGGQVQSLSQPAVMPVQNVETMPAKEIKKSLAHLCPNLAFVDKNQDCRVNQADVFVLIRQAQAAQQGLPSEEVQKNGELVREIMLEQDITGDGAVTLQDYSVLAYYWTY